jgi:hypothetical protein
VLLVVLMNNVCSLLVVSVCFHGVHAAAEWKPCDVDQQGNPLLKAACAEIAVPYNWDDPADNRTLVSFVKRVYLDMNHSAPAPQLWALPGGNGVPSSGLEASAGAVINGYCSRVPTEQLSVLSLPATEN